MASVPDVTHARALLVPHVNSFTSSRAGLSRPCRGGCPRPTSDARSRRRGRGSARAATRAAGSRRARRCRSPYAPVVPFQSKIQEDPRRCKKMQEDARRCKKMTEDPRSISIQTPNRDELNRTQSKRQNRVGGSGVGWVRLERNPDEPSNWRMARVRVVARSDGPSHPLSQ